MLYSASKIKETLQYESIVQGDDQEAILTCST
jgi:hypothetical protein